ncbi:MULTISPECIES: DUF6168 family protein [Cellulophaga]|uniref:ATP synthase protein I2 n=2 Tax=Cellulophaga TaxID=104264 RepID=F0RHV0_CELLC|nr:MULTISPECIES: DUF6168 family protein [Cellulophaga]ADY29212.1 hypothetical protein Celly_1387 [Cellulophaga lytica DSM 7489]AIM60251.1 hypothetical protein IX49_06845 [Cellulophaga lytica]EWH14512.1 hypothetical protein KLA_04072 [Cellulophaga geojensis KL-A]MDO6852015.1 DUF6168 family protein [Cellulophaga lytica]TVZ08216.1 hypothetical protein JM80_0700 [Cellulophaga sp. RHA_52]
MANHKLLIYFFITILISLAVAFGVHLLVLDDMQKPLFDNKIVLSYVINFVLVTAIFTIIYLLRNQFKTQLGIFFIVGSAIKFLFFFMLFYPSFNADDNINLTEFASFFVPYSICLLIETFFIAKVLKNLD